MIVKENIIVSFKNVSKTFRIYSHLLGFKNIIMNLMNLKKAISGFRKDKFVALQNLNLEIVKGHTYGIMGKNGAGKSTLLSLIAGVIEPDEGEVVISGTVAPLLELGAGFHPDLTGYDNIILNAILLGLTRAQARKLRSDIIDFSELGKFIHQPIRYYSSGMLTRLGFSVAAHIDADIILLDEVLAVGDQSFQKKCFSKIKEFQKAGKTIIFVSHSDADIKKFCDKLILIQNHKIIFSGSVAKGLKVFHSL